jgi:hypothetical protein
MCFTIVLSTEGTKHLEEQRLVQTNLTHQTIALYLALIYQMGIKITNRIKHVIKRNVIMILQNTS